MHSLALPLFLRSMSKVENMALKLSTSAEAMICCFQHELLRSQGHSECRFPSIGGPTGALQPTKLAELFELQESVRPIGVSQAIPKGSLLDEYIRDIYPDYTVLGVRFYAS